MNNRFFEVEPRSLDNLIGGESVSNEHVQNCGTSFISKSVDSLGPLSLSRTLPPGVEDKGQGLPTLLRQPPTGHSGSCTARDAKPLPWRQGDIAKG